MTIWFLNCLTPQAPQEQPKTKTNYKLLKWGFPKLGVPPKSSILTGCSIPNHCWNDPRDNCSSRMPGAPGGHEAFLPHASGNRELTPKMRDSPFADAWGGDGDHREPWKPQISRFTDHFLFSCSHIFGSSFILFNRFSIDFQCGSYPVPTRYRCIRPEWSKVPVTSTLGYPLLIITHLSASFPNDFR